MAKKRKKVQEPLPSYFVTVEHPHSRGTFYSTTSFPQGVEALPGSLSAVGVKNSAKPDKPVLVLRFTAKGVEGRFIEAPPEEEEYEEDAQD